jgi:hypothetical protein
MFKRVSSTIRLDSALTSLSILTNMSKVTHDFLAGEGNAMM